eukprot:TRINITY_DN854_c0_g1_i1.p1 TRINITY_DN854_c0_g1~~TRINITY_DN854_c0_g1_i1.p1  ORF type:complete len:384 (+),score=21.88 TRINITY_DN854_c0_g1_i1:1786-2937(+)
MDTVANVVGQFDMSEESEEHFKGVIDIEDLAHEHSAPMECTQHEDNISSMVPAYGYRPKGSSRGKQDLPLDSLPEARINRQYITEGLTQLESSILNAAFDEPMIHSSTRYQSRNSPLNEQDITDLMEAGIIEPADHRPKFTLPCFKIPKKSGGVGRLLVDGRKFDENTASVPAPITPSLSQIETFVSTFEYASTIDFLGYFLQFGLGSRMAGCLGVKAGSKTYNFLAMVPGTQRAPTVAQLGTKALRQLTNVMDSSLAIYDDVLLGAHSLQECEKTVKDFRETCKKARVTIREDKFQPPGRRVTFAGIEMDLVNKTISIPTDWKIKVTSTHATPRTMTCRAAAHHLGALAYAHWEIFVAVLTPVKMAKCTGKPQLRHQRPNKH